MGAGYFKALNDSDFSDPDEILVVKSNRKVDDNSTDDFLTGDGTESRSPTYYDAGFQVENFLKVLFEINWSSQSFDKLDEIINTFELIDLIIF